MRIIEEVLMLRIHVPILIVPTAEAQEAVGPHLQAVGLAAYREIAVAAKGLEIAHLQFVFGRHTLAVCSRVRGDGVVEIELGLGDPRLPKTSFTAAEMRRAEAATRARDYGAERKTCRIKCAASSSPGFAARVPYGLTKKDDVKRHEECRCHGLNCGIARCGARNATPNKAMWRTHSPPHH